MLAIWITAARPKTLIASLSPICIGTAYAIKQNIFDPWIFLWITLFALFIQIGTNFANDYFDFKRGADTAERKGPSRVLEKGWVTPSLMQKAILIVFTSAFLFSLHPISKLGIFYMCIPIISIFLGIIYTGGPWPLAYLGLSEIFVILFFGLLACWGAYYGQTMVMDFRPLLAGFGPGFVSTAILVINNLRDVEEDSKTGKKTLVVRFGKRFGKAEYIFCLLVAFVVLISLIHSPLSFALLLWIYPLCKNVYQENDLAILLPKTAQFLLIYTIVFCMGILV